MQVHLYFTTALRLAGLTTVEREFYLTVCKRKEINLPGLIRLPNLVYTELYEANNLTIFKFITSSSIKTRRKEEK